MTGHEWCCCHGEAVCVCVFTCPRGEEGDTEERYMSELITHASLQFLNAQIPFGITQGEGDLVLLAYLVT